MLEYLDEIEDDYEAVPDSFSGVEEKTKEINEEENTKYKFIIGRGECIDVCLTTKPQPIEYETEFPCYKLNMSFNERRRIEECYTEHPDEDFYTYCGKATSLNLNFMSFIMTLFIVLLTWFIWD
uniref:Uncharacterized protein n=1 Tax=Glossina brevipalpis TaxID=37001 RepID=A0A1A9WAF6_9MUSC